jgi:isopentenyl-diphosphate delta-isomerase
MSSSKKKAHIDLAFQSQTLPETLDRRFTYEPLMSAHPEGVFKPFQFLGKTMRIPVWVSSMTGGTDAALTINRNLARACNEFGMGMGLGSCRLLLEDNKNPEHFYLRKYIGPDAPFYANLGIVQIEKALEDNTVDRISGMIKELETDGLIIHVNPLQELLQPEGDRLHNPPIDTIRELLRQVDFPVIVKEVGQGMGPESLKQLAALPLQAIEFAAFGGTNFARLELQRSDPQRQEMLQPISFVGNDASEMLETINNLVDTHSDIKTRELIISGGIRTFLDGYYFIRKSRLPAIYGQASMFLKYARDDYDTLKQFIEYQIKGLEIAYSYLSINE